MAAEETMTNAAEAAGPAIDPMHQFTVRPLFGEGEIHWYTPTNAALWMGIAVLAVIALMVLGTRRRAIVPSHTQSVAELAYGFVYQMVKDVAGAEALRFFPYIMTIFTFIIFTNFLGLIPMSFSVTSQIAVTVVLALLVFVSVTLLGFYLHGVKFLGLFWVKQAPLVLRPILAVIEVISYFVRPVSHSIRLAGNVMAGHAVIEVFASFAASVLIAPIAMVGIVAMFGMDVLVAFIQAYVFTILTCVYLKDALHPSH